MSGLKTYRVPMSKKQLEVGKEAVKLLKQAHKLLRENEANVDEAKQIRDHVVKNLLPSRNMYIPATHPDSLLRDLDKRIRKARYQMMYGNPKKKTKQNETSDFVPKKIDVGRYGAMAQTMQRQSQYSLLSMLLFILFFIALILVVAQIDTSSNFSNAFEWIAR